MAHANVGDDPAREAGEPPGLARGRPSHMTTQAQTGWTTMFALNSARSARENKLAALLDNCLARMQEGREPSFALRHSPEAAAEVRPLLEIATLLQLRGRLARRIAT